MAKITIPFLFTLPLSIMGTRETSYIAAHMGDLVIEGQATSDEGGYHYKIDHIFFNKTDVKDLFRWLVEETTYNNHPIHTAVMAHITKSFEDLAANAEKGEEYVAVLSEGLHHHSNNYRQFPIGSL